MSRAKVYTDVNVHRPREYWDYESLTVQWGYIFYMLNANPNSCCQLDHFFFLIGRCCSILKFCV